MSAYAPVRPAERVAVVGSGISGLTAAYYLATRAHAHVSVYEADDRLGGHTHTHRLYDVDGTPVPVDSGFIVHNNQTYPHLLRLFAELGVDARDSEMSMSIQVADGAARGLEYAGGRGARGILAQPWRVADPRYVRMLSEVKRFHLAAQRHLRENDDTDATTFGAFLERHGFGRALRDWYARPLVACVWSTGARTALDYPARYLFRFLDHHGMLQVTGSPQWRTVVGGSCAYVERMMSAFDVRTSCRVREVRRADDHVTVRDEYDRTDTYDRVVLAGHADQMLHVLGDATSVEREVLGAFRYTHNRALVHSDASLLPRSVRARACWNYIVRDTEGDEPPLVTYWMNRLQGLETRRQFFVTLNSGDEVDPLLVHAEVDYTHPVYDLGSVRAQSRLPGLTTTRTAFAGAHHGWGFHEDGCRSGVAVARAWGVES